MKEKNESPVNLKRWTKLTFLGWLLGVVFIVLLSQLLDMIGIEDMQFYIGIGMGAGVGLCQWKILKERFRVSAMWVYASVIGMAIPFLLMDFMMPGSMPVKLLACITLGSVGSGIIQYFELKKLHKPNPILWVFGTFAGWTSSTMLVLTINYTMAIKTTGYMSLVLAITNLLIILSAGVVLGLVTGKTLNKVLRTSLPDTYNNV